MTTKKPAPNGTETGNAAADAEREDPLTSFGPPAGTATREGGTTAGTASAEPPAQGNGSEQAPQRPGGAGESEAAAQPTGTAQPNGTVSPGPGPGAAQEAASAGAAEEAETLEPDALELARQEAADGIERLLRLQAEFENYKKRIQKEHSDALRYALTPLVTEVAAIMDNLERAVEHARKEPGNGVAALLEGVEMVVRQMQEALGRFGVRRMEAVGKPFDPSLHEAINVVETQDVPENQVLEEYQAGYVLHDRVVRPARVCVSKRAPDQAAEPPPAENRS